MSAPIEYELTIDDLARGIGNWCRQERAASGSRLKSRLFAVVLLVMAPVLMWFAVTAPNGVDYFMLFPPIMLIVFALIVFFGGAGVARSTMKALQAQDCRLVTGPHRLDWVEGGLLIDRAYLSTLHRPGSFAEVGESDSDIFLVQHDRAIVIIPIRVFANPSEAASFAKRARDELVVEESHAFSMTAGINAVGVFSGHSPTSRISERPPTAP